MYSKRLTSLWLLFLFATSLVCSVFADATEDAHALAEKITRRLEEEDFTFEDERERAGFAAWWEQNVDVDGLREVLAWTEEHTGFAHEKDTNWIEDLLQVSLSSNFRVWMRLHLKNAEAKTSVLGVIQNHLEMEIRELGWRAFEPFSLEALIDFESNVREEGGRELTEEERERLRAAANMLYSLPHLVRQSVVDTVASVHEMRAVGLHVSVPIVLPTTVIHLLRTLTLKDDPYQFYSSDDEGLDHPLCEEMDDMDQYWEELVKHPRQKELFDLFETWSTLLPNAKLGDLGFTWIYWGVTAEEAREESSEWLNFAASEDCQITS